LVRVRATERWREYPWWAPCGFSVVAIGLAAWSLALEFPDRKWWATTLQLVGGAVAFLGFSGAYVRAAYGLTLRAWIWQWLSRFGRLVKRLWNKLWRKPRHITIHAQPAVIRAQMGTATVGTYPSPLALDETLPLEQQVARIADYANELQLEVPKLMGKYADLTGASTKPTPALQNWPKRRWRISGTRLTG
jgi:hypothetical protein